jgi:DNA-binding transcriptional MerR regulator
MHKAPDAFRTISEASDALQVPAHVLRFWESKFSQVKPVKRAGGRRYYRPADIDLLSGIKTLLYDKGMTIRGVQKLIADRGARQIAQIAPLSEEITATPQDATTHGPEAVLKGFDADTAPTLDQPEMPDQKAPAILQPPAPNFSVGKDSFAPRPLQQGVHTPRIRPGALAHALRLSPPARDMLQHAKPLLARLEALRSRLDKLG